MAIRESLLPSLWGELARSLMPDLRREHLNWEAACALRIFAEQLRMQSVKSHFQCALKIMETQKNFRETL